jgi:hypothetical protein
VNATAKPDRKPGFPIPVFDPSQLDFRADRQFDDRRRIPIRIFEHACWLVNDPGFHDRSAPVQRTAQLQKPGCEPFWAEQIPDFAKTHAL